MKGYVLTLFLLVGFVWSASAQQVDSSLVGNWETTDGPCSPCTLTIQENGVVKFDLAGSAIQVVYAQVTPEPGVEVIGPQGGKLDLSLTRSSGYLVGNFTHYTQRRSQPVSFRRISVSTTQVREIATGGWWSVKKQILGESVYNDAGEKVGEINDLIVTPAKDLSYAIVGVGGFLGVKEHEIAVSVGQLKQEKGKIVLPGATKDALKAMPKFEYAK